VSIVINNRIVDTDSEALELIRRMVGRLLPSWQHPARFHENKSEILGALALLSKIAAHNPHPLTTRPPRASGSPLQPARSLAIQNAEQIFRPPQAAPERPQGAVSVYPRTVIFKEPRRRIERVKRIKPSRRRHRYPRPPRSIETQGALL
jgi:hypothetical protein